MDGGHEATNRVVGQIALSIEDLDVDATDRGWHRPCVADGRDLAEPFEKDSFRVDILRLHDSFMSGPRGHIGGFSRDK